MSRSESFWPKVQDGAREGHLSPTEATATQQEQNHEMLAKCMFVESWAEPWQLPHVCHVDPEAFIEKHRLDDRAATKNVPQRAETDDTEEVAGTAKPLLSRHIRARAVARLGQSDHKASFQE